MADFTIKRNDTSPSISYSLGDAAGDAVNLTGASVVFKMAKARGSGLPGELAVDSAAVIVTASEGDVRYDWDAADTEAAGDYVAEFEVTYSDGEVETFPNAEYITVTVKADIS